MSEQICEPQVVLSMQRGTTVVVMLLFVTQVLRRSQGPYEPHGPSVVQVGVFSRPAWMIGKKPRPAPSPMDLGSEKKVFSADLTASHLLGPAAVASAIDFERSTVTYRSSGTGSAMTVFDEQTPSLDEDRKSVV